jgi:hypothetical protein
MLDCNGNGIPDAQDIADGTSTDCNTNAIPDECDIADGTSTDCNANELPDECDIADCAGDPACGDCNGNQLPDWCDIDSGTSGDCNTNDIPDECDIADCAGDPACGDCNENQIPDGCDIDGGTSGDCNTNDIPDECDIANCEGDPACGDCNGNQIPDGCDIASGASSDENGNGSPDECEVAAPLVECEGPRYLMAAPQPPDLTLPVALLLSGDVDDPEVSCISLYVQTDGTLGDTPVYRTPAEWSTLHLHGEEIVPGCDYHLHAELEGGLRSPGGSATTWIWGDVDGNGFVNIGDVLYSVFGFQGDFTYVSLEAIDLSPCTPDRGISIDDVLAAVNAFVGDSYLDGGCSMPCR